MQIRVYHNYSHRIDAGNYLLKDLTGNRKYQSETKENSYYYYY